MTEAYHRRGKAPSIALTTWRAFFLLSAGAWFGFQVRNISDLHLMCNFPKNDPPFIAQPRSSNTTANKKPSPAAAIQELETKSSDPPVALPKEKWAYAFLVAGCSSEVPQYRGFLYNVAVAAQRLQDLGSKADVVLWVQMSVKTNETSLTQDDLKILDSLNVKVRYMPKFATQANENFYSITMEKFRILTMTEYSRVLFLDSDVIPVCNLDYLFQLSEPPEHWEKEFKENIITAGPREPANAGFFLFKPNLTDYETIQKIIRRTEERALQLKWPYFDPIEGFGHKITLPDHWIGSNNRTWSTNWTFHCAHADQGLLYHWPKYVKQDVSIIAGKIFQHWGSRNGSAYLESFQENSGKLNKFSCLDNKEFRRMGKNPPFSDFQHFVGRGKPWLIDRKEHEGSPKYKNWFSALKKIEEKVKMELVLDSSKPPVGVTSYPEAMIKHIREKKEHGWAQYAICDAITGACSRY